MMIVLLILTLACALLAMQSSKVLHATLWLACVSALTAILFYSVGAQSIAVIELSVGTGLVTVLMVFAITMIGDDQETLNGKRFPLTLVIVAVLLFTLLTVPLLSSQPQAPQQSLSDTLWNSRGLDMLPQIALMFAGILGIIGLLNTSVRRDGTSQEQASQPDAPQGVDDYGVGVNVAEKEAM